MTRTSGRLGVPDDFGRGFRLGLLRRRGALTGAAATLAYVVLTMGLLLAASLVVAIIAGRRRPGA